jgi:3-oxoacyl-[acyl-carrier-protein] synthase-3
LAPVIRSIIRGCGSHLPARLMTNAEVAGIVDTSDEWIVQRTGIRQRYIADETETTSVLGVKAAQAALADAGLTADDIDLVVCATSTPDYTFPSTASQIQMGLGIHHGAAFDVQAVCTGFIYAVSTADKFLRSGSHKRALVVGAETFSRIIDWTDRGTCVLFGDGAGAIVLEAAEGNGDAADRGVLTTHLRSDGRYRDRLYVDGGPGSTGTTGHLRMEGRDVVREAFEATGTGPEELAWFVPHQANRRIIEASADKLGIARDKVVITVDRHGNTSAASIPLALDVARKDGRIREGDLVMLEAIGGGFTWGSALLRW